MQNQYSAGVLVYLEHNKTELAGVAKELLGVGRILADKLNTKLTGILIGNRVEKITNDAIAFGADIVFVNENVIFENYVNRPYTSAVVSITKKYKPEIFLVGATTQGRDLAGSVATELETGLTADCTELDVDPNTRLLYSTRPTFGGNLMATILCETKRPQMATVRPRVLEMPKPDTARKGKILTESYTLKDIDLKVKLLEVIESEGQEGPDLEMANVIVAGGRGLGDPKNFAILKELANILGGELGSSRPPVEAGWIEHAHQIGQTGLTVRPRLYIACGISGAIQHAVGMRNSDVIIAINSDPDAPIFNIATYGIVGDLTKIVPAMTEEVKKLKLSISKR
ncbi:MAG: electron transfer flavoprotein subunit alpha/FixB family protein [Actinobacteria bacterium]|nr:electron transfer flavoprotein subunit alpha/FixB family protein [Actinomycetota bacterium]